MNRQQRRASQREIKQEQRTYVAALPETLTPIPLEEFPPVIPGQPYLMQAWRSRNYVVQLYDEPNRVKRLSVCRARRSPQGWVDGITWDELQTIKHELGFGDLYGVEVYPRDRDVINVANFRHLWLLPEPLPIGWFEP